MFKPVSLFILILIPLLERLEKRVGSRALGRPLTRMAIGMFVVALSFAIGGFVNMKLDAATAQGTTISVWWQLPQYIALALAEVLVSVTGLEFFYSQAPKSMKSMAGSIWLMTTAVGDFFAGVVFEAIVLPRTEIFFLFAGLTVLNTLLFLVVRARYRYEVHTDFDADEFVAFFVCFACFAVQLPCFLSL